MIGRIKGKLVELEGNVALIETASGVSYEVNLTSSVLSSAKLNHDVEVYSYLHVREDAQVLFGFLTKGEHNLFKLLIGVQGVGPRIAFTVVSFSKEEELLRAVRENNINFFSNIPGLGKKTAMKIILELSQKLGEEFRIGKMYLSEDDKTVIDALVALGFKTQQAKLILSKLPKELSIEDKIKQSLQLVTNKNQ